MFIWHTFQMKYKQSNFLQLLQSDPQSDLILKHLSQNSMIQMVMTMYKVCKKIGMTVGFKIKILILRFKYPKMLCLRKS